MKSTGTIIWQALLFAVVATLINVLIISLGEERTFIEFLLRGATLIQFVIMWLVGYFFISNRSKGNK